MSYLFVDTRGACVHYEANRVIVKQGETSARSIPVENLEAIYIFTSAQVTSQCVAQCLKHGISISYFSKSGVYFGRLYSTNHVNARRQRKQAALADTEFSLNLAKNIICGKIHNQKVVLARYARSENKDLKDFQHRMQWSIDKIRTCKTVSEVMGYEGNAARLYFEGLSQVVHEEFKFQGRSKRPPRDEFNSMLSLGYSILMNEIYGRLENKGLNPYFGFIHSDKENHPTLASDMMEEWRATIVDSMSMSLVNGNEIHVNHFTHDEDNPGYYLTKEGLNIFLKKIDKKMQTPVKYLDYVDYAVSFRRAIDLQLNELVRAIETEDASMYHPIWLR
ncbi:MAG: CRISPR-associated endonuclease Cas1 [Lachnospiraceae bacterium]|nr:CRISPR-associated endonuclease Cas1 [Lachnospiraceae bacterium]